MKDADLPPRENVRSAPPGLGVEKAMRRFALGLAITSAIASLASPSNAQTVTFADALRQALRPDNPALRQQDDLVAKAAGQVREASGAFDWNMNMQGGSQLFYVPTAEGRYLTNNTSSGISYYYSVNIGRLFRNGVEVTPGVTAYPGSGVTPAQTAGLTQLRPSLGLKIPLLQGFGKGNTDAIERGAIDTLRGARENRTFAVGQFAQNVVITFWRCVADDQILKETQEADKNAEAYGANLTKMAHKGVIEPTIMQQWAANNVTQHLNVGRAQDEARRCHRDLAYMMTGDPASPWLEPLGELPRVEDYSPALDRLNEQTLIALALDRRTDLKALMENIQASHELLRSAKNAEQPALDLHLDPEHSFVSFTKKFGNNTARGKEAQAASAEDQAHLAFRQLQDQVHDQVSDALANLRRAASDWAALNDAEKQMGTVVTDAEKRARFGAINWSEYLTAQNQLTQLRQQVINARLAFADNLALLRLVTGSIDPSRPASLAVDMVTLPTP